MKTLNTFSISFFLRKDKGMDGNAPMYVRVTVNGKRSDIALKRSVSVSNWNQKEQKLSGNSPEYNAIREKIRTLRNELNAAYDELRRDKKELTDETVKARAEGIDLDAHTLMFLINYHNEDLKQLVEEGTMKNYRTTKKYLEEFLMLKWKKKDILLTKLDNLFVTNFGLFLLNRTPDKGQRPCSNNSVMKHMERLRKMVGTALENKWMSENPSSISKERW